MKRLLAKKRGKNHLALMPLHSLYNAVPSWDNMPSLQSLSMSAFISAAFASISLFSSALRSISDAVLIREGKRPASTKSSSTTLSPSNGCFEGAPVMLSTAWYF